MVWDADSDEWVLPHAAELPLPRPVRLSSLSLATVVLQNRAGAARYDAPPLVGRTTLDVPPDAWGRRLLL